MDKLGFGFMRLPVKNEDNSNIDFEILNQMVDKYIENGGNYFDTGFGYHNGNSEIAIRECVINRYPREKVLIADKLPLYCLKPEHNLENIFNTQLKRCGVDYFDYYMVHNTTDYFDEVSKKLDCFGFIQKKKEEGKVKYIGLSHHDTAESLERLLNENPNVDFVQLQINYLDWDNEGIQARKCYEVARAYGKEVIVMEPLKGGTLVNIPEEAKKAFKNYNPDLSISSWGIRYCASLEGVSMVLTGMSNLEQMEDNISYMKEFKKLNRDELKIIEDVKEIIADSIAIPCTYCNYCIEHCPNNIPIPKFFALYNDAKQAIDIQVLYYIYYNNFAQKGGKASDCDYCGECNEHCTQHLDIPDYLEDVKELLEVDLDEYLS